MMLGRFKDAISDVAETIRRAFKDPYCHSVPLQLPAPGAAAFSPLEASCIEGAYRFKPVITIPNLAFLPVSQGEAMEFKAALRGENAWAAWASGAKVCEMRIFQAGNCGRLAVPPLPRSVPVRKVEIPSFRTSSHGIREVISTPVVRGMSPKIAPPRARCDLDSVLGLPIAIGGEDFQKLPRALNMRYTFQLVKATGENIRNLDVLGVYPVPVKGVAALQHDPHSGRILVNLNQEAVGARRGRFILARKKDDRSFVSCFVEE